MGVVMWVIGVWSVGGWSLLNTGHVQHMYM